MRVGLGQLAAAAALVGSSTVLLAVPTAADSGIPGEIDPCKGQAEWCLETGAPATESPGSGQSGGSGSSGSGTSSGGGGGGSRPTEKPVCGWATIPASAVATTGKMYTNGQPPAGADVVWQAWCPGVSHFGGAKPGPLRWLPAADAPPAAPPTAAEVAQGIYQRMQGNMPIPSVATTPPTGTGAIVGVPVFVSVTNWQNELVETGDLGGATVTVRATPQLVVNPGNGDAAVPCAGPGTLFDPAAGDLWAQAAAGDACSVTYGQRTGVSGRPAEWPSTVTVRWSISWSATSGESGTFPAVDRSVAIPRAVSEVRSVVVSGGH